MSSGNMDILLVCLSVLAVRRSQGFLLTTVAETTTCNPACISYNNGKTFCECPSTKPIAASSRLVTNTFSLPASTPSGVGTSTAGITAGCRKIKSRDGVISSSALVAGSPFQHDCTYLIDLGEGYQGGQKYVHIRFEQLQFQECGGCSCEYLQFENSEFSQPLCSTKDVQINRSYKMKPANTTDRYLQLHYHTPNVSTPSDFRMHYEVLWGNSTNECEGVTCPTKCPHGVLQDYMGCPMCLCATDPCSSSSSDSKKSLIMKALMDIQSYANHIGEKTAQAIGDL